MPGKGDIVQVIPGVPRFKTVIVGTGWAQLPDLDGCLSVLLKPRTSNTAIIYVATFMTPVPNDVDRIELPATDPGVTYDISNPKQLFVASATGSQKLELHMIVGNI